MIATIPGRPAVNFLRELWDTLGEIEQMAVREALYGPGSQLDREQLRTRYGVLLARSKERYNRDPLPLDYFLYPESRYAALTVVMPENQRIEHIRRDMVRCAQRDLSAMRRLVGLGRGR